MITIVNNYCRITAQKCCNIASIIGTMLCPMLLRLRVCFGNVAQEVNAYSVSGHRCNGSIFCFSFNIQTQRTVIQWGESFQFYLEIDPFLKREHAESMNEHSIVGPSGSSCFSFSSAAHSRTLSGP